MPTPEEGRAARIEAEQDLHRTKEQWSTVHDMSMELARIRQQSGPDPFIEALERSMGPRPRHHPGGA